MSVLPKVPPDITGPARDYLIELVRQMERELDRRHPVQQDGKQYIGFERPYVYVDEDGEQYNLVTDGGFNMISGDNTFSGINTFTSVQNVRSLQTFRVRRGGGQDGSVNDFFEVDAPDLASGAFLTRIGRNTNTTGNATFILHNCDGTTGSWFDARRDQGVTVGSPSGGAQGAGTINAEGVYDDGTLLTDYVFDAELDGQIDVDVYDNATPDRVSRCSESGKVLKRETRTHGPARAFKDCLDELDPAVFESKWRSARKLPAVARCSEHLSLGQLSQALLETCEVQAVHIAKLEARICALEENNDPT